MYDFKYHSFIIIEIFAKCNNKQDFYILELIDRKKLKNFHKPLILSFYLLYTIVNTNNIHYLIKIYKCFLLKICLQSY